MAMKKWIFSLVMVCGAAVAVSELKDGVYPGKAGGYMGPVRVAVTVKAGRIDEVEVTACRDGRARKAVREIPRRIVRANSAEVDAVSGATITSGAIKGAVRQALEEAR